MRPVWRLNILPRMHAAARTAAGLAAVWSLPALAPLVPALATRMGVPRTGAPPGAVAITFDDGPHPEGTPRVLALLADAGVSATFFLVGEQVERHRSLAAEIAAAGHAIALHGHRHRVLLRVPPPAVRDDLARGAEIIAAATGVTPVLYRPPLGIYSWPALSIARARGLAPILWSRWGHDWRGRATPGGVAAEVAGRLESGDVLLLHDADHYSARDSWRTTVAALPRVLELITAQGLTCAALDQGR
jgi:peptidoglycan/xylan/chitin deacetylase (PgdA/CDA1 family)